MGGRTGHLKPGGEARKVVMEVRLAVLPDDAAGIAAIDTTVQTTNVLAASVGLHGVVLRATPQTVTKRFAIDDLSAPDRPWTTGWVVVDDAQIIGFAAVGARLPGERAGSGALHVDAGRRGQGLGRRLMAAARWRRPGSPAPATSGWRPATRTCPAWRPIRPWASH